MARKQLPIGIQTLAKIRAKDCYYVDKTPIALRLIAQGSYFFLSRPRRFGKSLFLDTLKELFEGNRALFEGLHAEQHWDWSVKYPVLRFSFGGGLLGSVEDLRASLDEQLGTFEARHELPAEYPDARSRFKRLILRLAEQTGQRVVVLIDEYDKPVLDRIEDQDVALQLREVLKDFYSVIKDSDAHIRFALLTGVSKFSKVSIFSGLNNLQDITLDPRYSAICGYAEHDIDTVFAPELPGLDRDEIRRWYNGYNWRGESVYNPFDVLLLFSHREFRPYWFESGTPTFLVKLLTRRRQFTPALESVFEFSSLLSSFEVDNISTEALLFQSGYLTVDRAEQLPGRIGLHLRYPNLEVKTSLNTSLLAVLCGDQDGPARSVLQMYRLLQAGDLAGIHQLLHSFFASIPHDWYRGNPIAQYEGYWASVFYSYFAALGLDMVLEDATNQGRIDMALRWLGQTWLFEFKVVELVPEGRAIEQLQQKNYADKYRASGPVHLVGVEFSRESRNIVAFDTLTFPTPSPPEGGEGVRPVACVQIIQRPPSPPRGERECAARPAAGRWRGARHRTACISPAELLF
ncbi:ATP-binding protein [Melaminivora jejuensis]|uniref:ATP-binding protein n=1 Tax=Melaminivora jejuensis TaxID=1267217 RepID=UPI001E4E41C5|nr:ATP-binding protein [Melaminivora jejuensis]UHJ64977.1 ATP-binding protein [Melaminivora jejuensis]